MKETDKLQPFDLTGRVAVITGAAGLLGRQHAAALLECGAVVYVADVNERAISETVRGLRDQWESTRVRPLCLDVTRISSVEASLASVEEEASSVDILINNAAIDAKVSSSELGGFEESRLENFSLDRWRQEIDVGLTGAFLCSRIFGARMADNRGGVILNIASDLSVIAPDQRIYRKEGLRDCEQPVKPVTYSVIKTALIGLTRYLAAYWAERKVRVNALSPGGVYTDQPDAFVQKLTSLIPLGRMAHKDEYRSAVQFLCSDASSYLTGQNLVIDGGRSIL